MNDAKIILCTIDLLRLVQRRGVNHLIIRISVKYSQYKFFYEIKEGSMNLYADRITNPLVQLLKKQAERTIPHLIITFINDDDGGGSQCNIMVIEKKNRDMISAIGGSEIKPAEKGFGERLFEISIEELITDRIPAAEGEDEDEDEGLVFVMH